MAWQRKNIHANRNSPITYIQRCGTGPGGVFHLGTDGITALEGDYALIVIDDEQKH